MDSKCGGICAKCPSDGDMDKKGKAGDECMKNDDREAKRRLIRRIVELHFRDESNCDDCPMNVVYIKELDRVRARVTDFLLDDRDADLKDEVLRDMFLQICEEHSEPKEPEWNDVLFLSRVTGRTPKEVKESIEQNCGKRVVLPS
jgi:hypothetical protein